MDKRSPMLCSFFAPTRAAGREVSKFAMLVRDRVLQPYLWASNPVALLGGADVPYLFASVDILLAYNAGKACGLM
jgi:hypothetical protein